MSWGEYFHQSVKHWQALVGSLIGFSGIIVTLAFNSRLGRRSRSREMAHKRQGVRAAFMVELFLQYQTLQHCVERVDDSEEIYFPLEFNAGIYDRLLSDIIVLPIEEIDAVLRAYGYNKSLLINLSAMSSTTKAEDFAIIKAGGHKSELKAVLIKGRNNTINALSIMREGDKRDLLLAK